MTKVGRPMRPSLFPSYEQLVATRESPYTIDQYADLKGESMKAWKKWKTRDFQKTSATPAA